MVLLASAKSPYQIQIPKKTCDEWNTHESKYNIFSLVAIASATAFRNTVTISEGVWVEAAGNYVSPGDQPVFLSLWCRAFRKEIQGVFSFFGSLQQREFCG